MESTKTFSLNGNYDDITLLLLSRAYSKLLTAIRFYNENEMNSIDLSNSKSKSDYVLALSSIAFTADNMMEGSNTLYQAMNMAKTSTIQSRKTSLLSKWKGMTPVEKKSFDFALNDRYREIYRAKNVPITENSLVMSDRNIESKLSATESFLESPEIKLLTQGQISKDSSFNATVPDLDFLYRFSNATVRLFVTEYIYSGKYRQLLESKVGMELFQKFIDMYNVEEERQKRIMSSYNISQMQI